MDIPKLSALFETSLASAMSAAATSFSLVSATDRDGNALSGLYGFIIDEGTADEEFVLATVSGTTATVVYRGIDSNNPNTEVSGNKKAHRRGASVKITDYPILGVIRQLLNGEEGFPNPLKYANGVAPVSADDLVDKAYADALLGGGTLSYDRVVIEGTAGETIASGNLVYLKIADGRWWKCDADTAATVDNVILGIAQGAGTAGNAITNGVLIKGLATNMTGLTANTKYYASNTAGAISTSAGTVEVSVGFALSTTSLLLDSRYDQQITEDQQDALAGKSGTAPSNSNKFEDEADTSATSSANKLVRAGSDGKIDTGFIKSSKKIALSTTEVTFTNGDGGAGAGSEQTLFSTTIPGGTLSTNNGIRFTIYIRDLNIIQTAGGYVFKVKYGGSTQLTLTTVSTNNNLTGLDGFLKGYILADGATNAQKMTAVGDFAANEGEIATDATVQISKFHVSANGSGAIDSTTDQTLTITLTQANDTGSDCVVEWCVIESIA